MLENLKNEMNTAYTENGAKVYASSLSHCLDLFATVGGLRHADDKEIINRFIRAFAENPDYAMKILFYARDVRGGLGERRVFRVILNWLANAHPATVIRNLEFIGEYGRFDDLLGLTYTPCESAMVSFVAEKLESDKTAMKNGGEVSLLAKWLPSVNASSKTAVSLAKRLARKLKLTDAEYRKTLVSLRNYIRIIENNLREKDYTFDYSKQPSKAMFKYRAAFARNDGERYREFLEKVSKGEATLHTDTLYPYELVDPYLDDFVSFVNLSEEEELSLNTTWASLPDFTDGENAIAVVDTSGSMYYAEKPKPASVALSLGIYFAERSKGVFKNHFIEFSEKPQLIELKGETFTDKLEYICTFCEIANTNMEAVFDVILKAAVDNNVDASELPSAIYIISDMEFDEGVDNGSLTIFESAKQKYESAGYKLPKVVFWNVASRNLHLPVRKNEQGVVLVSGCTPRLFSMVLGGDVTPEMLMLEVIGSERYAPIAAWEMII